MTDREYAGLAPERVFSELETVDPAEVVVPLRAPAERVPEFRAWLDGFDVDLTVLWCDGPRVESLLAEADLDGARGKGRDVWLALGVAADNDYVVVHDADTTTYEARDVRKLLFPLSAGFEFSKGYYARVENDRLYGRLFRLFYEPLVAALDDAHDHEVLSFLGAFRYALAGECAMTGDVARGLRVQRKWGLEVGTLGEAFRLAGTEGAAQVDLGRYEHDHRAVSGPTGLSEMSEGVGSALFRALEDAGVDVEYDTLPERYLTTPNGSCGPTAPTPRSTTWTTTPRTSDNRPRRTPGPSTRPVRIPACRPGRTRPRPRRGRGGRRGGRGGLKPRGRHPSPWTATNSRASRTSSAG